MVCVLTMHNDADLGIIVYMFVQFCKITHQFA